jgi:hypothetical protein
MSETAAVHEEEPGEVEAIEETEEAEADDLDTRATILLGLEQVSSSFSYRAAEFAFSLFFVVLYTNTLLPASVCTTIDFLKD